MAVRWAAAATSAALLFAAPALAAPPEDRDWGAALALDAQALHDDLAANHPGQVNDLDPGFRETNERQLKIALERAKTAKTYADYFFPLRIYTSAFNDGHLGFGASGDTPNDNRWPGFATDYDGQGRILVTTSELGQLVPRGAQLVDCDGVSAERYAEATLGVMWGRWELEAQRRQWGPLLFLDESSNLIPIARQCTFSVAGKKRTIALSWRPIPVSRVSEMLTRAYAGPKRSFGIRQATGAVQWIWTPSFNGDPQSEAAKALPALIGRLQADRQQLLAAPAIVLDLRGNGGGTSDWSRQMAGALWGPMAIAALKGEDVQVDWRASPANLVAIATSYDERRGSKGFSNEADNWFRSVIAGMGTAIARKQVLWRHVDFDPKGTASPQSAPVRTSAKPSRPIYVLTDSSCASACLDAVDLWTALGAIQVGKPTSADTLYMEIRPRALPSGLTSISVPMKVYRGRKRGSNEPAMPPFSFTGDINDTPTVEQWVAGLVAQHR